MIDLEKLEQLAKTATSGLAGDRVMFAVHVMDPEGILALTAEVRRLRAERDGAIEAANANALDASRWRHIYDCGYIICRVLKDGTVQNLGGSYVGKYAVDDLIAAVKAAYPKEGV